ncbi:MAG: outer membrane protein assembly factor BamA [bacterium]|nr:outer membrane protein assembly factor BamA [bacterium]
MKKISQKVSGKLLLITAVIFSSLLIFSGIFSGVFSQPSKYEGRTVKKISFQGLSNIDENDLRYIMKTDEETPLKAVVVREDIKKIFKKGRFESVSVEIEEFQGGVQLRFICKERLLIRAIEIKGMDEMIESELTELLLFKEGSVLRKDHLEKSVKRIKDKYDDDGFFNAVITYKIIRLTDEESSVKVLVIIDEGEEIKVQNISLLGSKKVYVEEILSIMETQEDGFIDDGSFKKDIYEQDKAKIVAYYKQLGYLDAQILEDRIDYEWVDPTTRDERGIFITIKVSEGDIYYFDKYSMEIIGKKDGTSVYKPEDFLNNFELNDHGDIFNNTRFQLDRQMISMRYGAKGYIFARVVPKRTVTEKEVEVDGVKEKRKYVSIHFTIHEGLKAFIESIIIKGNKKTKDKVIRREVLVKEGELFDNSKVQLSRERVYNLQFFKEVNIDVRPGSREGYMNLIFDVEEQPTGTISLGGGYGTSTGFSIFADIGENNLFGNGQRVGLKFEYGPLRRSVTLSFAERWLFDYPVGFDASIFYQLYKQQATSIFSSSSRLAEVEKQSFGYSMGLSYRFWYYYNVGTRWSHAFKSYLNPTGNSSDEVFRLVALPVQEKRTVYMYAYRDSKDNYLNPTSGSKIGVNVGFTGGIIGGDDHFVKMMPEMNFYFSPFHLPFLKSHPCVFEFRASGDFIMKPLGSVSQSYEDNPWLEFEDRMLIGGVERGLRGWSLYDTDLPESWQLGLHHRILYGVELRIPIHPQMLWLAWFFDAGSLWADSSWKRQFENEISDTSSHQDYNDNVNSGDLRTLDQFFKRSPMSYFRYSYGFGFRIQIPMMPLRFWFGRKLVYDHGFKHISGYNFQFGIGDMRF